MPLISWWGREDRERLGGRGRVAADANISSLMLQLSAQMMPLLRVLHDQQRMLRCLDTEDVPLEEICSQVLRLEPLPFMAC